MTELYFENNESAELNNKKILECAEEKFGDLAGVAQQYLFYWRRELQRMMCRSESLRLDIGKGDGSFNLGVS